MEVDIASERVRDGLHELLSRMLYELPFLFRSSSTCWGKVAVELVVCFEW